MQTMGLEPIATAWKAADLPLIDACVNFFLSCACVPEISIFAQDFY
jgi:hypothetical protein